MYILLSPKTIWWVHTYMHTHWNILYYTSEKHTVTSWNCNLMAGPAGWGRLLISRMVLSKTPSRLSTISSTSSETTGSYTTHRKTHKIKLHERSPTVILSNLYSYGVFFLPAQPWTVIDNGCHSLTFITVLMSLELVSAQRLMKSFKAMRKHLREWNRMKEGSNQRERDS